MADKKVRMAPELQETPTGPGTPNPEPGERDVKAEQTAKQHDLDQQHKREAQQQSKDAAANLAGKEAAKEAALATKTAERQARADYLQTPLSPAEAEELLRLEKIAMGNRNVEPETMHRLSDLRIRAKVVMVDPAAD